MRICFAFVHITHDGTQLDTSSIAEFQGATTPVTLEAKMPEAHGRRLRVSGCENLEWATLACLSDANFRQALPLCLVRAFVDKNDTTAVAAMNRVRPPKNECDAQSIESPGGTLSALRECFTWLSWR
jgi:hypothetical protein